MITKQQQVQPTTTRRRRTRATLAITSVDFMKLWSTLEHDLLQVLMDPFNAKLKNDTEKLHNIVYKLSTGQCFNLPPESELLPYSSSSSSSSLIITQEGDIQPQTLYIMLKKLISNHLKMLILKLNTLSGISLLRQYFTFWNNYLIACDFIMKVFHYLNSDWISEQQERKSKIIEKQSEKSWVHFSESNHVCNTKLTCLLLWREWFFERCDNKFPLVNNNQEVDSPPPLLLPLPPLQQTEEESTSSTFKYNFYETIMKMIEMDRNYHYPHKSKNSNSSINEFYPMLKKVIESLVYLSLDPEDDYYFNVKYKHYPSSSMNLLTTNDSLSVHIGDYYSKVLVVEQSNKQHHHHHYPIFYLYDFERLFLQNSKKYYCSEIDSLLLIPPSKENQSLMVTTFLQHISIRLDHEINKNILHYIPLVTKNTIQKVVCDLFIEGTNENMSSLHFLLSDIEFWLNDPEQYRENLENLYKIMTKSSKKLALRELGIKIRNLIFSSLNSDMRRVKMISNDTYDPIQFIDSIIGNYNRFNNIVQQFFSNNFELNICKDTAFKEFFNNAPIFTSDPNIKCAEYLSRYINHLLKGSNRPEHNNNYYSSISVLDNLDIESRMDYCVCLCKLLNDVDVFIQYYKVLLAKRLLIFNVRGEGESTQQQQEELEYTMLTKLKKVCTFGHVYKIQTMLNDLNNAKSLAERFKEYENDTATTTNMSQATSSSSSRIQFTAKVLTKGYWPLNNSSLITTPSANFTIPPIINDRINSFSDYYSQQYNGRHLTWLHILSKGVVRAHFNNSSMPYYDITVSLIQLSILLQFNGENSRTVQELSLATGLNIPELIQTLTPIINFKIFSTTTTTTNNTNTSTTTTTNNGTEQVDQNTVIVINENFNHNRNKVALFQHSIKQYYDEGKSTNPVDQKILAQIKEDRKYTLQAAIVRILKTRKQIEHKQLVNLLLAQLSSNFKPTNSDIKRALDSLLQQEYIKRVSEDSSWYQYLA